MDVSEERVCFVGNEEIDMALSYEELKPYLYETVKSIIRQNLSPDDSCDQKKSTVCHTDTSFLT